MALGSLILAISNLFLLAVLSDGGAKIGKEMSIPTTESTGDDLQYLADTDAGAAQWRRAVEAHDYIAKRKKYIEFLAASGSVAERTAIAESSAAYAAEREKYFDAIGSSEEIQNKRKTAQLRIEVWRSLNANRRQAS